MHATFLFFAALFVPPSLAAVPASHPFQTLLPARLAARVVYDLRAEFGGGLVTRVERIPALLETLSAGNAFLPPQDPRRQALLQWLLSQEDHSVLPHALLQVAVRISGGHVQRGLMLAWDVLREGWRRNGRRNFQESTLRLADLTGEVAHYHGPYGPQRETCRGDNFSAWYHFFGTALDAYVLEMRWNGLFFWRNLAAIELQRRFVTNLFVDDQTRVQLDRAGARFGRLMAQMLRRGTAPSVEGFYLVDDPSSFANRTPLAEGTTELDALQGRPGLPPAYAMAQQIRQLRSRRDRDSLEALVTMVTQYAGPAFPEVQKPMLFGVVENPTHVVQAMAIEALGERGGDADTREYLQSLVMRPGVPPHQLEAALVALAQGFPADFLRMASVRLHDGDPLVHLGIARGLRFTASNELAVALLHVPYLYAASEAASAVLQRPSSYSASVVALAESVEKRRLASEKDLAVRKRNRLVGRLALLPLGPARAFIPSSCANALAARLPEAL